MPSFDDRNAQAPRSMDARRADERAPYEPPLLTKKRSVAQVTLTSGVSSSGTSGATCVTCH
jgi:hypothetical protein